MKTELIQYPCEKEGETYTMLTEVVKISQSAFYKSKKMKRIVMNEKVEIIEDNAFEESGITTITIPQKVQTIGKYAFRKCESMTTIEVHTENGAYKSNEGVLFTKNGETIIQYPIQIRLLYSKFYIFQKGILYGSISVST